MEDQKGGSRRHAIRRRPENPEATKYQGCLQRRKNQRLKLLHQVTGDEKIQHIDIVSLYPTVNKHEAYPIGHPEIIVADFKNVRDYFGIIKCTVKAPPQDFLNFQNFPILPMTCNDKLVFPLCQKCATDKVQTSCPHEGADRYMEGTWCTPEIHQVWHWKEKREHFFAAFVDKFLKIKTEASGWPSWCIDDVKKQKFLNEVSKSCVSSKFGLILFCFVG